MKKLLGIALIIISLCGCCAPALAASLPAKAARAIEEAGWEGYKTISVVVGPGYNGLPGAVFALLRKDEENLLCALRFDEKQDDYRLYAANEHILPPGNIKATLKFDKYSEHLLVAYSVKDPAPGYPSHMSCSFSCYNGRQAILSSVDFTYPADGDGLVPHAIIDMNLLRPGSDSMIFISEKYDLRGKQVHSERKSLLKREAWVYDLRSFTMEQAFADIAFAVSAIDKELPPPLTPEPASVTKVDGDAEILMLGETAVNSSTKTLDLSGLDLTDISVLAGLRAPVSLDLSGNRIADLWPLAGLASLRKLYLADNRIGDLSPLAGLEQLEIVYLSENPVTDLTPLARLKKIRELRLDGCNIVSLTPLASMPKLVILSVCGNRIDDLSPLAKIKTLTQLCLNDNTIVELSPLKGLTKLQVLEMNGNQITDLRPLKGLSKKLDTLKLNNNNIVDVGPLGKLTHLWDLSVSHNQIADLNPLATAAMLYRLEALENPITSLNRLMRLRNLHELYIPAGINYPDFKARSYHEYADVLIYHEVAVEDKAN